MNAKWTSLIVAGGVLVVLSGQVMAQPWGGGGQGRGQGFGRGQGMGMRGQGRGSMMQGMGRQGGPGAGCPLGAGPGGRGGRGGWNAQGPGQLGFGPGMADRLGLSDEQVEKIRDIVAESRSRTHEAIKDVLTEEQAEQFDQMRPQAGQPGRGRGGPAFQDGQSGPAGRGFRQGRGRGAQMGPQGQGRWGQPFAGRPRAGRGMGWQRGVNPPQADTGDEAPADTRDVNPAPSQNRAMPPIERMFDQADANDDGALTKEEIRAFHENMGSRPGRQRQGW